MYATELQFQSWAGKQVDSADPGQIDQVSDKVGSTTYSSSETVAALTRASSWIDSYLAKRYTLPILDSEALIALELPTMRAAFFDLCLIHPSREGILARSQAMFDLAKEWLEAIANGDAGLPGSLAAKDASGLNAGSEVRLYASGLMGRL